MGVFCGMRSDRRNQSIRRQPAPALPVFSKDPEGLIYARTLAGIVGSRQLIV